MKQLLLLTVTPLILIACASADETSSAEDLVPCGAPSPVSSIQPPSPAAPVPMAAADVAPDDRVGYPVGYREAYWQHYVFDRFDAGSISFVCANDIAASVEPGEAYPYGSVLVFESWRPLRDAYEELVTDAVGHLIRSELGGIFLMRKEPGFGEGYGDQRSGEWEYVAFRADGTYQTPPERTQGCASCHGAGAGDRDFVFRTNVHFRPGGYARSDPVGEGELGISRMGYAPRTHAVEAGATVVWRNSSIDGIAHTVTAADGSFDSGVLAPGESFSFAFEGPGEFEYTCALHPQQMRGVIEVSAP